MDAIAFHLPCREGAKIAAHYHIIDPFFCLCNDLFRLSLVVYHNDKGNEKKFLFRVARDNHSVRSKSYFYEGKTPMIYRLWILSLPHYTALRTNEKRKRPYPRRIRCIS